MKVALAIYFAVIPRDTLPVPIVNKGNRRKRARSLVNMDTFNNGENDIKVIVIGILCQTNVVLEGLMTVRLDPLQSPSLP
jgi:hypothetical protein